MLFLLLLVTAGSRARGLPGQEAAAAAAAAALRGGNLSWELEAKSSK
jgi:hypothetical protein